MNEKIKYGSCMPTIEYNLASKSKEILTHAITWVKLEDIGLSKISQSWKGKYCMIPLFLHDIAKVVEFI